MPRPPTADLEGLLRALLDGHVEFIVVGGAAAVIHGVPVTTQDPELRVRVIDLETLIAIKQTTGRARDALAVPLLLALRDRRGGS